MMGYGHPLSATDMVLELACNKEFTILVEAQEECVNKQNTLMVRGTKGDVDY